MPHDPPPTEDGPGTLPRGATISRYVLLGLVGRGGMGEVYAAYDPELDRKVAVKLLRIKPGAGVSLVEGRQRTLREAQAIARLSHPNVVVVFDVGTFRDQVFIAMEFVEGNTATYWVESQARNWQEVLKMFMGAGRGLMAAHEKGLVHRDFKPDNVMVGRDGNPRVMDFGLARQVGSPIAREREKRSSTPSRGTTPESTMGIPVAIAEHSPRPNIDPMSTMVLNMPASGRHPDSQAPGISTMFNLNLTRTGAMMGTPAYMAPEQFLGTATDARTDQFSFCIALYEALYGERPFDGNTMYALTANVVQGNVRAAPKNAKVPLWVRKILLRGLKPQAAERWASMAELIDVLGKDPRIRRRKVAVAMAAVLLPVALTIGIRQSLAENRAICTGGPAKLAGIWEPQAPGEPESPRHAQIHNAFLQTGKGYAADVYATVSQALTRYSQSWADMYLETCQATQVRAEQSADVMDLRMSCLQERLGGLHALTDVFKDANGEVVENAVSAANALGSLDRCADVPLLRALLAPPEDQKTRARVEELRHRIAQLKARFDAGNWKESLSNAPGLVNEARVLGYQPLVAEVSVLLGTIQSKSNETKAAEQTLTETFWIADACRHDEVRAEAAASLVFVIGYQEGRFEEAKRWAKTADAVLRRLGGHELLQAWLANDLGCVYDMEGNKEGAVRAQEKALLLKEKALGRDHPDVGASEGNLAMSLQGLGRNQEALVHNDRAVLLLETGLGAAHPELAVQLNNRGETLNALGRHYEARQSFERARVIWERELGLDDRNLGYALTGIGLSYLAEEHPSSALVPLERASRIRETRETDPSRRAETAFALAQALWETNRDFGRARALADSARETYLKATSTSKAAEVETWLRRHSS